MGASLEGAANMAAGIASSVGLTGPKGSDSKVVHSLTGKTVLLLAGGPSALTLCTFPQDGWRARDTVADSP